MTEGAEQASAPQEPGTRDFAAILSPIPSPRFLTALCALNKVDARILSTSGGPVAVLTDTDEEAVAKAAKTVSAFVARAEFMLVVNRGGQATAQIWLGGQVAKDVPAGLALNDAPGVLTTLVTGAQSFDEIAATHPDKVHEATMSRFAAYRELLKETRRLRKEQG
ncbi:hypothetical protein [Demequina lignilytica]|uniref:Roadblock/LAMTOR2 domain-containing protein n=1 Tax=Demequina lignilytica TaxID=3051663 RepID=A0AAW7M7S6_9MICO|nr:MULTISPECIES: hypothetical protein [unclassified Demequina]MDN4477092.1 hypothetical protein [Demequina sp. SYSU T00039-1]MDN4483940.1 hypothetical protein [Demequina sp. SYSU T0a273]MDN4487265.1 hypothetical protein [Demequina sp. SYSU T00039]MDN4491516.1 hypothetical protein [Demequina sp. SYSU T00068]